MPEHTSWFSYLLALPNFRGLWALFNHLACQSDANPLAATRDLEMNNGCPAGYHVAELPLTGTYPANTPITMEPLVTLLFALALVAVFVMVTRAHVLKKSEAVIPEGRLTVSSFTENFVDVFYGMLRDVLGKQDAAYFLPIIGTSALFIFFSNVLALIPGFNPPTSNLNITIGCGLVIFAVTHIYGVRRQGWRYINHFLGPFFDIGGYKIPMLAPLMLVLEIISHLARPLALGIRLCVNLFVDHLMVSVFTGLCFLVVPLPIMLLGVLVVVLQTYVFCLLSTIYIQMAVEQHDDHAEHAEHTHTYDAPIVA